MYKLYRFILIALASLIFHADPCRSELFYFPAVSPTTMGTCYANAPAGVEDITQQFFNPAITSYFHDDQIAGVGSVFLSRDTFNNEEGTTITSDTIVGQASPGNVSPHIGGGALYGSCVLTNTFHLGLAVTTPWRKKTLYAHDWVGRYYGTKLEMVGINIAPTLSWSIHDTFHFGIGPQIQNLCIDFEQAIDFGSIGQQLQIPGAMPGAQDGFMDIYGNSWGYGWVFGVAFEPCWYIRLGAGYRSKVTHEICATSGFDLSQMGREVNAADGLFSGACSPIIQITTPASLVAGIYYFHNDYLEATGSVSFREWESTDGIVADFGGNADINATIGGTGWLNAPTFSAGVKIYHPSGNWYAALGGMYQASPVGGGSQTPLLFGDSNGSISIGWGFHIWECTFFDAAWLHTFDTNIPIEQNVTETGNTLRGDFAGDVHTKADIISVSIIATF